MSASGDRQPLVSVVIPSYNQGRYIRRTLDSILEQDYRPLEILVIDGASTDDTVEVLREYGTYTEVRWISEPDRGPVDAVNKGLAMAQGEYCGIQSSDDYYLPGAIRAAVDALSSHPSLGLVYGDYIKVDQQGAEIERYPQNPYSLRGLLAMHTVAIQPTVFFRLAMAKALGGWSEELPYVPDTDLWLRLAFTAGAIKLDRFQACIRSHDAQRDVQRQRIFDNYTRMLRNSTELNGASWRDKLAAKSGLHQIAVRYGTGLSDWEITRHYWQAIFCYPPVAIAGRIPLHRLVPGYFVLTRWRARVRALLARHA